MVQGRAMKMADIESQSRQSFWRRRAMLVCSPMFLLAGMMAVAGVGSAQSGLPDAQVEANVLKALAGSSELASESISTNTVYGVVTLSGSVRDEGARVKAENLAANAVGVKKVVDELQVGAAVTSQGTQSLQNDPPQAENGGQGVLQSDGTYAPAPRPDASTSGVPAPGSASAETAQRNDPDNDQAADLQREQQQNGVPAAGQSSQTPSGQPGYSQPGYGQPQTPPYGASSGGAPPAYGSYPPSGSARNGYPSSPQNGYPQRNYPQQNYPPQNYPPQNGAGPWGGQVAGERVVIPQGTLVRVRVNRLLASDRVHTGDRFDGFVANDVVAGGFVAIPRGAAVQGTVVDAHGSGTISGRGELSIAINSVTLGGQVYPVVSDVWAHNGGDKTIETVNKAAGFGVVGAVIGAIAGGGEGAAIGAGVGAAAGIGSSAASPRGQVVIPPEGMVSFNLAQPVEIRTVSEQEIQRLAYGVPPAGAYPPSYARRPIYVRPGYPPPPAYGYPPY